MTTMKDGKLIYKIAITLIPGIGNVLARNLIAYMGDVEAPFREKKQNLMKVPGIGEILANEIINQKVLEVAEKELDFIEKNQIQYHYFLDDNYPLRLKQCNDSPILLYSRGQADFNTNKIISIVGTRNATNEGRENVNKLIKDIAERGHPCTIVSGLAYGIDIAAHKAALINHLPTIAVVAHGLDMLYPADHKNTAKEIIGNGAVITEFVSKTKLIRQNFVARNRIIAGMSDATIVAESGAEGGSLITAELANSYNRDVFAFPGRISDKHSAGCNKLIKINKAALIESVADLEYILGWEKNDKKIPQQTSLFVPLTAEEKQISDLLKTHGKLSIDVIAMILQLPMNKLSPILLNMEFSNLINSYPGKVYELR